jgi:hypothetical protein
MNVLVPVDANGFPQQVLPKLYEFIEGVASHVTLLLVDDRTPKDATRCRGPATERAFVLNTVPAVVTVFERPEEPLAARERELRNYLERVASQLDGSGARVEAVVCFGDPETAIANAARSGAYDLIVTVTHAGVSQRSVPGASIRSAAGAGGSPEADAGLAGDRLTRQREAVAA